MTYLVAKPYSPRGSGRGECIKQWAAGAPVIGAVPVSSRRPKRPWPEGYQGVERSAFSYSYLLFHGDAASAAFSSFFQIVSPQPNHISAPYQATPRNKMVRWPKVTSPRRLSQASNPLSTNWKK